MEGPAEDAVAPESWEVADVDETMRRLLLSAKEPNAQDPGGGGSGSAPPATSPSAPPEKVTEDALSQVDQFLREALENPRERLSILRMEQDVEKFIRDPMQKQMEFQQLPTSYLRLAAHRVAQHYGLQSMVLLDTNLPDASNSRIIVSKTSECRIFPIRLADIPVNLPSQDTGVMKVAIKQRPQKRFPNANSGNSNSLKSNSAKSVEERKEEYNRARARIFNSNNFNAGLAGKPETGPRETGLRETGPRETGLRETGPRETGPRETGPRETGPRETGLRETGPRETGPRFQDNSQHNSLALSKMEEKALPGVNEANSVRGLTDSATSSSASARSREKEPIGRHKSNSRVAIFRDREVDRKDPDYDRNYDRYMQRFDPGFGFPGGPYTVQPMYTPAINYNTEFPQLGSSHRPQVPAEHQPRPLPQHIPAPWSGSSSAVGIGYGHPDMIAPFSPNHVNAHSSSAYLHSSQYACQRPGMPFVHPNEHVHPPFTQSHHQQPDASFGLARPR
ncbi:hypothetical protein EUGRSUZ_G02696 [Eucalyptus grandis]|uniref:SUZ domain-containing protein n=5 Tax=Eucalyptus grandis TaxID=71139 RepID=A0A059BHQ0_EUCGR|nr:hypothetical protein EUGRSUZ_G02696 [Eucalyptus grandis]KAK3422152.1 hypothetical protein EUGRSUZ_G02696 [Eucalyptus grandis]KAK3422153.1 hypothetical protein EUGRSUZ_G02696 [Eucalyptus grandis]KAK3422154.1 hypothetical protein EUGRSUZ_G02696 [Eucalyptus grandis]